MDNNTKPFKLLACDIENERINESYSELYDKLKTKLEDKTPAEKRRLQLNTTSQEEDLLSDFAISPKNDYIYGVMFRISPAKEAPSIPADFFKQERIQIDEIQEKEQNANIVCKDHYYFFLNKNFLVTTQPKSKIRSFQTYLNWFLESLKTNDVYYKFAPKIKSMDNNIKLSDIKKIEFSDINNEKSTSTESGESVTIANIGKEKLSEILLKEVPNYQQMIDKKILSAKLLLQFAEKPKKMKENEYAKLLSNFMKPIGDDDGITLHLKDKRKISGSNIIQTISVDIEKINDFKINEEQLRQEMLRFLRSLK